MMFIPEKPPQLPKANIAVSCLDRQERDDGELGSGFYEAVKKLNAQREQKVVETTPVPLY